MHLFKHFWKMIGRNKSGIIIYSIVTMVMVIMMAATYSSKNEKTADDGKVNLSERLDISYIDNDNSVLSNALINYLGKDNNLTENNDVNEETINDILYFEIVTFHIEIPEGFQQKTDNDEDVNIEYKTSLNQSAYSYKIENIINAYTNIYSMYVKDGMTPEEAVKKTDTVMNQELDIKVYSEKENYSGSDTRENVIYHLSLFITYLGFSMIAMTAGKTIISGNGETVASRISAGPVSETKRSMINTLGLYSFAVLLLVIYTLGIYLYAGDSRLVSEKGYLLVINSAIAFLYCSSLTAFITSFNIKESAIPMIVNIIGLAMSFLCGIFVPMWFLGEGVLKIARFLPFYWTSYNMALIFPECGAGYAYDITKIYENFGISFLYVIVFALGAVLVKKLRKQ